MPKIVYQVIFTIVQDVPADIENPEAWADDKRIEAHPVELVMESMRNGGEITVDMTTEVVSGV